VVRKIICNLILLCFVPRLYAPSNIYEEKVGGLANTFLKDYAKAVNGFEKSYQLWVAIKNSTTTLSKRGEFERQQFDEADRAFKNLLASEAKWQSLKNQVESLP